MNIAERHEKVMETVEELRQASLEAPVIVEGKNDGRALRSIGVRGEIVRLNNGSSIFHLCEELGRRYREVIILTDWDRRGGQLCRLLREGLAANGVKFDLNLRARLTSLCRKEIKDVEGLGAYVRRIMESPR